MSVPVLQCNFLSFLCLLLSLFLVMSLFLTESLSLLVVLLLFLHLRVPVCLCICPCHSPCLILTQNLSLALCSSCLSQSLSCRFNTVDTIQEWATQSFFILLPVAVRKETGRPPRDIGQGRQTACSTYILQRQEKSFIPSITLDGGGGGAADQKLQYSWTLRQRLKNYSWEWELVPIGQLLKESLTSRITQIPSRLVSPHPLPYTSLQTDTRIREDQSYTVYPLQYIKVQQAHHTTDHWTGGHNRAGACTPRRITNRSSWPYVIFFIGRGSVLLPADQARFFRRIQRKDLV